MNFSVVQIEKPADVNVILGHSHFIKTVEDLYETIVQTNPGMKFGVAFCEASGPTLLRFVGNDEAMITLAQKNGMAIAAGHTFLIFMDKGFPVNILNAVKMVPEVCRVYCASANPVEVLIAETDQGRGIVGVIDGFATKGVETDADIAVRRDFLRRLGYKL
jgi:adenosine/AMP kinase